MSSSLVVWIGRRCWPNPHALVRRGEGGLRRAFEPRWERGQWREREREREREHEREREGKRELALEKEFDRTLLRASLFVDIAERIRAGGSNASGFGAHEPDARLWAIDLALRCTGVALVVADGRGLDMAATRRLQLAAEAGQTVGLLARAPDERATLSAAATRWLVRPAGLHPPLPRPTASISQPSGRLVAANVAAASRDEPGRLSSDGSRIGCRIELLRCKWRHGMLGGALHPVHWIDARSAAPTSAPQPADGGATRDGREWLLERDDETGDVVVVADVADRCDPQGDAPDRGG
ncbi:MAG: hypothetical protein U0575_11820 [Phycisphaerales bacterium]